MHYIDGFVLPVLKKNMNVYVRMAKKAGKIWREHGALEYRECVGDDQRPAPAGDVQWAIYAFRHETDGLWRI